MATHNHDNSPQQSATDRGQQDADRTGITFRQRTKSSNSINTNNTFSENFRAARGDGEEDSLSEFLN